MLPILLAVSAAGAVLELKRFVHRGGSSEAESDDVQLQQEAKLKELLQSMQSNLQEQQTQLQEEKTANDRLRAAQAELASTSAALAEENTRLCEEASRLQSTNEELSSKMESLSTEHTEEMDALRGAIVDAMNRFAGGSLSVEGLMDSLRSMGLQICNLFPGRDPDEVAAADTQSVHEPVLESSEPASTSQKLLMEEWGTQMRLMSQTPEHFARMLTARARPEQLPNTGQASIREPSLLQSHPHLFTHRSLPALERSTSDPKVPALQLDQLAKQAEPAPSKPPVEITLEAQAVAQPAETSQPALQPVPKPNVPQLIFLPEKGSQSARQGPQRWGINMRLTGRPQSPARTGSPSKASGVAERARSNKSLSSQRLDFGTQDEFDHAASSQLACVQSSSN